MQQKHIFINKYTLYSSVLFILIVLFTSIYYYAQYIENKKETSKLNTYKLNVVHMKKELVELIKHKKSSTVAMALSISVHGHLADIIEGKSLKECQLVNLSKKLREETLYKNIWIQLINKDGDSVYRSWTDKKGDNLLSIREDIKHVIQTQKVISTISAGRFDLSLKAIVPIVRKGEFIGAIEVISHFNSISKSLKKSDIDSIVLANDKYSQNIEYPFTNIYIGKNYVANFDAPKHLQKYLQNNGVQKYLKEAYYIENNYLIVSYNLKDNLSNVVGSYIMFKKITDISTIGLDFFIFKLTAILILILLFIVVSVIVILYGKNKKQKEYYKNIIDSSASIVILNDNFEHFLSVNKVFFKYFDKYDNLDDFKKEHQCICELFVKESTYLQKEMDGQSWVKYLVKNSGETFKVKIRFYEKIYYFSIFASLISKEKKHYSITLTDITSEEISKKELEKLTITDALTQIGNRRHFQTRLDEEIVRSYRYKNELSLIIFDIDNFKQVNDIYGHSVGDEVLIEYAQLINSQLRDGDELCRIGGEEFVIIAPHSNIKHVFTIAEKLRKKIEDHKKILPITMSFGVIEYIYGETANDMFIRVDKALYKAKKTGKNKVVVG